MAVCSRRRWGSTATPDRLLLLTVITASEKHATRVHQAVISAFAMRGDLSDFILKPFKAYFFHLNPRQHSLALLGAGRLVSTLDAIVANPGAFYFNVHSPANPGGFSRGQLRRVPVFVAREGEARGHRAAEQGP